jgi:hypothetical protein
MRNAHTTTRLRAPRHAPITTALFTRVARLRAWLRSLDPWQISASAALTIVLAGVLARSIFHQVAPAPAPIIIVATPALPTAPATPSPALAVAGSGATRTTARAVIAYSMPDPASPIGAVEPGRAYTPTAQIGDAWLVAEVAGSGTVYLQIAELYGLADLPRTAEPTPPPIIIVEQPQQPEQLGIMAVDQAAVPTAPPMPTPLAVLAQDDPRCTGALDGTIAEDCGLDRALLREAEQH